MAPGHEIGDKMFVKIERFGTEFACGDLLPETEGESLFAGNGNAINSANNKVLCDDDLI
ncbi:MAG: hypothetical protein ACOYMG_11625 [Candidatus Methylumidiphilus sp.]